MTQNQLRYWELRWKQFYDMRQLELEKYKVDRNLELEMRKLNETIRHNKAEERHDRLALKQNQEKINQEWAKIGQNERLAMIKYGIEYVQLEQKNIQLSQEQQRIGLEAQKLLQNEFLGLADLMLELNKTADEQSRKWVDTYAESVGEFLKAFGGGAAGLAIGELRGALSTSVYNGLVDQLSKAFPQYADKLKSFTKTANEAFGPQAPEQIGQLVGQDYKQQLEDKLNNSNVETGLPNSSDKHVIGFSGTDDSQQKSKSDYEVYSRNADKSTSGGTDYTVSGGFVSSGTIVSPGATKAMQGPGYF